MIQALLRWLRSEVHPITHQDVDPAPGDPEREHQIRAARGEAVGAVMKLERRSWEIRQELAGAALNIVSGER